MHFGAQGQEGTGVRVVPPPEGLARGRYETPRWTIAAVAILGLVLALAWIGHRIRRARKKVV